MDFIITSLGFFLGNYINYAPVYLTQKIIPNIFISLTANAFSRMATLPILLYLNKSASRRDGLRLMSVFALIFLLLQYIVDPSGCLTCLSATNSTLLLVFYFCSRFFINMNTNFYLIVIAEPFPAQIRSICICGLVGFGKISGLLIPVTPAFLNLVSVPYNIFFVFIQILLIINYTCLRETLNVPPAEMIEELKED